MTGTLGHKLKSRNGCYISKAAKIFRIRESQGLTQDEHSTTITAIPTTNCSLTKPEGNSKISSVLLRQSLEKDVDVRASLTFSNFIPTLTQ